MVSLLLLLVFCIYACYTDIRYKKIRNLTSFCLIYTGILLLGINVLEKNQNWMGAVLCLGVALFLGVSFYMMGGVGGGDAKFFIGLALVLSGIIPAESIRLDQLIPFILLVNTLVVYVFFSVFIALIAIPQFNEFLETFSSQITQKWRSLRSLRIGALMSMIWNQLSGILTFLAAFYTTDLCLQYVGHSGGLFTFLIAMIILYYLDSLWKRLHLGNVWKSSLTLLWMVHLSLNVRVISLTVTSVLNAVVLIAVFMFVYKFGKFLVTNLSEKALTKFRYASVTPGNTSIHISFAPFLSIASLLTLWAKGSLYKLFI